MAQPLGVDWRFLQQRKDKMKAITALIIGNEILAGRRQDAHLPHIINACNSRGLRLTQVLVMQDDYQALVETYRRLSGAGHMVLSYGGIGATPDDRTRQAVAAACGVELAFQPQGLAILQEKFGDELSDNRRQLVAFPKGADLIPNPINDIPGFSFQSIHCVPGFPQMAAPMMEWVLDTYCCEMGQERVYIALQVEAPESEISPLMQQLEADFPAVSISSLPQLRRVLELGFEGRLHECRAACRQAEQWLKAKAYAFTPL